MLYQKISSASNQLYYYWNGFLYISFHIILYWQKIWMLCLKWFGANLLKHWCFALRYMRTVIFNTTVSRCLKDISAYKVGHYLYASTMVRPNSFTILPTTKSDHLSVVVLITWLIKHWHSQSASVSFTFTLDTFNIKSVIYLMLYWNHRLMHIDKDQCDILCINAAQTLPKPHRILGMHPKSYNCLIILFISECAVR